MNQQITDSFKRISADLGDYDPFYFCLVLQGSVQVGLNVGGLDSLVSMLAAGDFHLDGLRSISTTHDLTFCSKSEITVCAHLSMDVLQNLISQRSEVELLKGLAIECRALLTFRQLSALDNRLYANVKEASRKKKSAAIQFLQKHAETVILSKDRCLASSELSDVLVFLVAGSVEIYTTDSGKVLASFHANTNPYALVHFVNSEISIRSMSTSAALLKLRREPLLKYFNVENNDRLDSELSRYILDLIYAQALRLDKQKLFARRISRQTETFEHPDQQLKRYILESKSESFEISTSVLIYESGCYASCFYVVVSGSVTIMRSDGSLVACAKPGNIFGQEAYLNGFKRVYTASVEGVPGTCVVIAVSFAALCDLSAIKDRIMLLDNNAVIIDPERMSVDEATIKNIRFFRNVKQEIVEQLCKLTSIVTYPANRIIAFSKDDPSAFYILKGRIITHGEDGAIIREVGVEQIFGFLREIPFSDSRHVVRAGSELKAIAFNAECLDLISEASPFIYGLFKISCKLGFSEQIIQLIEREFMFEPESAHELLGGVKLLLYQDGETLPINRITSRGYIAYVVKGSFVINPRIRFSASKRQYEHKDFVYFNDRLDDSISFQHNSVLMFVTYDVANILDRNFNANSARLTCFDPPADEYMNSKVVPWNLILKILDHKQLYECRKVCKEWLNHVHQLLNIKSVNLHGPKFGLPKLYGLLRMANTNLRRCDFNHAALNFSHIKLLFQFAPNITHLNLQECRDIDSLGMMFIFRNFHHLQKLEIYGLNINEPLIRSINCRNLQSLKVKKLQGSDIGRIDAFFQEISLELIEFSTERITDAILESACRRCKNLRELAIKNSWQVTDRGVHHIAVNLPKLVHLSLVGVVNITDSAVFELTKGPQRWEYLSFSLCSNLTDSMVFYFTETKTESVIHLDLSHCSKLTDSILSYVSQICPRLRYLNVSGCPLISDAFISRYIGKTVQVKKNSAKSKLAAMTAVNIPLDQRYTVHTKFTVTPSRKPATNLTAFL